MRGWAGILAGFCLALAATSSGVALGAPSAKDRADARALVQKAKAAAKAKKWGEAIEAYKKAEALDPSPQTELDLARAQASGGKLVDAEKGFAALAEATTPAAKKLNGAATSGLADVKKRMPHLKVNATPAGALVTVDDQASAGSDIEVDPGDHKISIEAEGYESATRQVSLKEGEHEEIAVTLTKSAVAAKEPVKEESSASSGPSRVPAIVAFGVGAVGIGVGATFGAMAFSATNDAKQLCMGNACKPAAQPKIDESKRDGNISTVAFVIGGVGVATGVVLLLVSGGKKSDEPKPDARVTPFIGPGSAGLRGSF
jgi:hypothetical protein